MKIYLFNFFDIDLYLIVLLQSKILIMRLLIFIIILLNVSVCKSSTLIWYSYFINESIILYQYFNDHENGFFVDVGAYHPVIVSNTLKLKAQGWKGINVDASYDKVKLFFTQRKQDLNLNYAIGPQPDKYIQFYDSKTDSLMSSIDPNVKNKRLNKGVLKTLKVPTISLAELCERYYLKRPQFMNLDVQGVGQYAVLQNNWKDIKCRPQVLMIEINLSSKIAGLQQSQKLLTDLGYKKIRQAGQNTVFIDSDVHQKYQKIAQKNKQKYNKQTIENFADLYVSFMKYKFNKIQASYFHVQYDNTIHPLFLYFAKKGENLKISLIRKQSNRLAVNANLIDRPIAIYQFNARDNFIIVEQYFTCEEISTTENKKYYHLKFNNKLQVYIFNMGYLPPGKLPNIINLNQLRKPKKIRQISNSSNIQDFYDILQITDNKIKQIMQRSKDYQSKTKDFAELKYKQIQNIISQMPSSTEYSIKQKNGGLNGDSDELVRFVDHTLIFIAIAVVILIFLVFYSITLSSKAIKQWEQFNLRRVSQETEDNIETTNT